MKYLQEDIDLIYQKSNKQIQNLSDDLNDKISGLKENFEDWKHPLDQQIKKLWFENVSYDRELKRYRRGLREFLDKSNISEDKIVQIHTHKGSSFFIPDGYVNKADEEYNAFGKRNFSVPSSFHKDQLQEQSFEK